MVGRTMAEAAARELISSVRELEGRRALSEKMKKSESYTYSE